MIASAAVRIDVIEELQIQAIFANPKDLSDMQLGLLNALAHCNGLTSVILA
jgi:hypothetical protein